MMPRFKRKWHRNWTRNNPHKKDCLNSPFLFIYSHVHRHAVLGNHPAASEQCGHLFSAALGIPENLSSVMTEINTSYVFFSVVSMNSINLEMSCLRDGAIASLADR